MKKQISVILADGTESSITVLANGATAIRYRQIFRKDLLTSISAILKAVGTENLQKLAQKGETELTIENLDEETLQSLIAILNSGELGMVSELAYVMSCQASAQEQGLAMLTDMSIDNYIAWLDRFDSMTFLSGAMDFIGVYMGNKVGLSTQKKEDAQLSDK